MLPFASSLCMKSHVWLLQMNTERDTMLVCVTFCALQNVQSVARKVSHPSHTLLSVFPDVLSANDNWIIIDKKHALVYLDKNTCGDQ